MPRSGRRARADPRVRGYSAHHYRGMSRNPRVTGDELIAALRRAGFSVTRVRGSHRFLSHDDGRRTVVPVHSGETVGPGLLHKILRDCELSMEEARNLLRRE